MYALTVCAALAASSALPAQPSSIGAFSGGCHGGGYYYPPPGVYSSPSYSTYGGPALQSDQAMEEGDGLYPCQFRLRQVYRYRAPAWSPSPFGVSPFGQSFPVAPPIYAPQTRYYQQNSIPQYYGAPGLYGAPQNYGNVIPFPQGQYGNCPGGNCYFQYR